MHGLPAKICSRAPHVLFRKWIIALVGMKARKRIFDILVSLPGQTRRRRITLRRRSMAPRTIPDSEALGTTRRHRYGGENNRKHRYSYRDILYDLNSAFHDPNSTLGTFRERRHAEHTALLQITDEGRDGFDLRSGQTMSDRTH